MAKRKASDAQLPSDVSQRQQKRSRIPNCGTLDRSKGETRYHHGQLYWRDKETATWLPAVHHSSIRRELLQEASSNFTKRYTQQREKGKLAYDETSFVESQQDWRKEREHWGTITGDVLRRVERGDFKQSHGASPLKRWERDGKVGVFDEPFVFSLSRLTMHASAQPR